MKRVLPPLAGVVALFLFAAACGPSDELVKVTGTPASPATDGTVDLAPRAEFGNAVLKVELTHVTPAERLSPSARVFMVWARRGTTAECLGMLDYDATSRAARFEGSVVSGPFDLLVTAETSARVTQPSAFVLLAKTLRGAGADE